MTLAEGLDTPFNINMSWPAGEIHTDPSYDNRTIASTLKMQIQMAQCLRAQLNASDDPLEVVERKPCRYIQQCANYSKQKF